MAGLRLAVATLSVRAALTVEAGRGAQSLQRPLGGLLAAEFPPRVCSACGRQNLPLAALCACGANLLAQAPAASVATNPAYLDAEPTPDRPAAAPSDFTLADALARLDRWAESDPRLLWVGGGLALIVVAAVMAGVAPILILVALAGSTALAIAVGLRRTYGPLGQLGAPVEAPPPILTARPQRFGPSGTDAGTVAQVAGPALGDLTKVCPMCAEDVEAAATVCPYCAHHFASPPAGVVAQPEFTSLSPVPARDCSALGPHVLAGTMPVQPWPSGWVEPASAGARRGSTVGIIVVVLVAVALGGLLLIGNQANQVSSRAQAPATHNPQIWAITDCGVLALRYAEDSDNVGPKFEPNGGGWVNPPGWRSYLDDQVQVQERMSYLACPSP